MALILEIVHPDGTRSWQRLDTLPLTVGRGLRNDLVLTDPYVDANHARIAFDETGALRIDDLGTVNGLVANDARIRTGVPLEPGDAVRIGRTMLRLRDADELVAPALVDDPIGPVQPAASNGARPVVAPRYLAWAMTTPGYLIIAALALGAFTLSSWLGTANRSGLSTAIGAAGAYAAFVAVWAGVWAVASRAAVHRFHYLGHIAVASAIALVGLGWNTIEEWVKFLLPGGTWIDILSTGVGVLMLCALIAGHLSLSSTLPRRRRWRFGIIIAASVMGVVGLLALVKEDSFTAVATFSGVVKPVAPGLIPTSTVAEFGGVMSELKTDVDELVKEK